MFFRRFAPAFAACALLLCIASCAKHEQAKQYPFTGSVVRLDPTTNVAAIHNDKVPGWMDSMTMEYPIQNAEEYKSLHPGDKITATVNVSSEGYWLTNVKRENSK